MTVRHRSGAQRAFQPSEAFRVTTELPGLYTIEASAKKPIPDANLQGLAGRASRVVTPTSTTSRGTKMQNSKDGHYPDTWRARMVRYLREWPARHGRSVHDQILRGAATTFGTGAVSLIVAWFQSRF